MATAEQIVREINEALTIEQPGPASEASAYRMALIVARRYLLSEGAPSEEQIERAQKQLAAEIHEAWEFQYDECDHGTYRGGHLNGEPYAMCELTAARIVRRRDALEDAGAAPQGSRQNETKSGQDFDSLDPEKVAEVARRADAHWQRDEDRLNTLGMGRFEWIARALCEAYTEGKLT